MHRNEFSALAIEVANALQDQGALPFYQQCTEKYSEDFIRTTLMKVLSIPESQIKRSRGALFTYLVNNAGRYGGGARH